MKNICNILIASLVGCLLWSCEALVKDVPASKLPGLEEKLAVHSFLSPQDTLMQVYVSLSQPLYSTSPSTIRIIDGDTVYQNSARTISKAEVLLSDGQKTLRLPYNASMRRYELRQSNANFWILPGKTYQIKVSAENKVVTGQCTIPPPPKEFPEVKIDTLIISNSFNASRRMNVGVSWKGEAGVYYRVRSGLWYLPARTKNFSQVSYIFSNFDFSDEGALAAGSTTRNLLATGRVSISDPTLTNTPNYLRLQYQSLTVELMATDEAYYRYIRSLDRNRSGNPFVEPTPVYTNVQGGLGCIAGTNRISKVIKLR